MIKVIFYRDGQVEESQFQFAVIAARYQGRWIYVRHRLRNTWEIPGGHHEPGETIEETARRELWEETGATVAEIHPVTPYGVEIDGNLTYGKLFFAEVKELGELSEELEIAEISLVERPPENQTYPEIQPPLFEQVQHWLNIKSNAGEAWDVYDANRQKTGRIHHRGDPMPEGDRHLVVHVWMRNSQGEYLLIRRSPQKGFALMWETTGGSALAGDDSITAALREVKEETGLDLLPENGQLFETLWGEDYICDIWLFHQDFDLADVVLQEGETCGVQYAAAEQVLQMDESGELVPYSYLRRILSFDHQ